MYNKEMCQKNVDLFKGPYRIGLIPHIKSSAVHYSRFTPDQLSVVGDLEKQLAIHMSHSLSPSIFQYYDETRTFIPSLLLATGSSITRFSRAHIESTPALKALFIDGGGREGLEILIDLLNDAYKSMRINRPVGESTFKYWKHIDRYLLADDEQFRMTQEDGHTYCAGVSLATEMYNSGMEATKTIVTKYDDTPEEVLYASGDILETFILHLLDEKNPDSFSDPQLEAKLIAQMRQSIELFQT